MEKYAKTLFIFVLLSMIAGLSSVAQAAELTVTSILDDGTDCTLRDAVESVNQGADEPGCRAIGAYGAGDRIVFHPVFNGSAIYLSGTPINIRKSLSVNVTRSIDITIDAGRSSRIFLLSTGGTQVGMKRLTLVNASGSAIYAQGDVPVIAPPISLTIVESTINDNHTLGRGGGIYAAYTDLRLIGSTISGNTATSSGGGIHFGDLVSSRAGVHNGRLSVINSTISGNRSGRSGGGGVFLDLNTVAVFRQATIAENHSENAGAGIYLGAGTDTMIVNSILAKNTVPAPKFWSDCYGNLPVLSVTTDSRSIIENDDCATSARNVDPAILGLANNGGPTQTHALFQDSCTDMFSPAINPLTTGTDICVAEDQRGVSRDTRCDTGAYESEILACSAPAGSGHYGFGSHYEFDFVPLPAPCIPGPDDNPDCRVPLQLPRDLLKLPDDIRDIIKEDYLYLFSIADAKMVGYIAERLIRPFDFLPMLTDTEKHSLIDPRFLWISQAQKDGLIMSCETGNQCLNHGYKFEEAEAVLLNAIQLGNQLAGSGIKEDERALLAHDLSMHAEYHLLLTGLLDADQRKQLLNTNAISVGDLLLMAARILNTKR